MNFKQSTLFSIVASIGLILFNMLINIIETRVLGPTEIGRYQIFVTTQTLFATFCALGLGQSCIYFINALEIEEQKVLSTVIKTTVPIAFLASVILFLIIILNPDYFGNESIISIALFCIGTDALLLNNIFTPVLLAKMEVVKNQLVKYATKLFMLVCLTVALLLCNTIDVGFLLSLSGLGCVLSLGMLYYYFINRFSFRDRIDWHLFSAIVKWGVKLSGNNIASLVLTSIPVYFLTWFSVSDGFLNVGYYSRANSLLVIGSVIASALGPLLYSKWSSVKAEELKYQVRRVSLLLILVNTVLAAFIFIFSPFLIELLYGENFQPSVSILRLLSVTMVANGVKEVCYGILSSQGHPLSIMNNLIVGIVLSALLNLYVIPNYGVQGCAIVTVFVSILTALLLQLVVSRKTCVLLKDFYTNPTKEDLLSILFFTKK